MRLAVRAVLPFVLLGAIVASGAIGCSNFEPGRVAPHGPQAAGGILDLRSWDFNRQGAVSLGGEWDFAPALLLDSAAAARFDAWQTRKVPDFWKGGEGGDRRGTGCGTYRLRVLLPKSAPPLAVRNYTGYNAFELEASGVVVAKAGRPATSRSLALSAYSPGVNRVSPRSTAVGAADGAASGGDLELLFRVSNWNYRGGGIWKCLILGDAAALIAAQQWSANISIALAAMMAALALNSFLLYVNRRKERSYLFFAVFGIVLALRPLVTGEYVLTRIFPAMSFELLVRLEYATAMLALPAAMAFFLSFFPTDNPKRWAFAFIGPFVPFVLFDVFLPLYWLTWSIFAFYAVAVSEIVLAASTVLARAVYRRVQGGLAIFAGGCLLALCAVNDVLYSSHLIETASLLPVAYAFFVVLQSFVLAQRFTKAFDRVELLSSELKGSNDMLKDEIHKAMAMSARLEESLSEKEMLLKEVHHRVKNSLQIVSSIVALQANRTEDQAAVDLARSIRERIRVISLANERLYDVDSGDMVDLFGYASDILNLAISSYGSDECRIEGRVEGERVQAESASAIDFGLVFTELVVNSLKHAILPKGGGRVVAVIHGGEGSCSFDLSDDGPGFPELFEPDSARSLGFKIIMSLLSKRGGSISISKGPGPTVSCSMWLAAGEKNLIV
jgi:two-component sensor histidine kinase